MRGEAGEINSPALPLPSQAPVWGLKEIDTHDGLRLPDILATERLKYMAKTTVTRVYRGRAIEPIGWEALLRIFDSLWGEEARSLPKFPKVFGGVIAIWVDAANVKHEVESINELIDSYQKELTAFIFLGGSINHGPDCNLEYWPAKAQASFKVEASDAATADKLVEAVKHEFPMEVEKIIFISYDNSQYKLATFIAGVIQRQLPPGILVFVAKRDILPGSNPLKVMLEEQLLRADALVALCSKQSKLSPWLWWESSAVWARGGLVIPLFIDISPNEFNGPITLVCQGRSFFEVDDINSIIAALVAKVSPDKQVNGLNDEEIVELRGLSSSLISR